MIRLKLSITEPFYSMSEDPHWKPDSTLSMRTLIELYKDDDRNNQITHYFQSRQANDWIFMRIGTISTSNEKLTRAGIVSLCFADFISSKLLARKPQIF